MKEANTTPAKYIFLDVVGFTNNRSVEAQEDIIGILNSLVSRCLDEYSLLEDKRILLPTGDGLCIALLNLETPYDVHIGLALDILRELHEHNLDRELNEMRKFQVRIGISSNTDNLVTDINGRTNIAGRGINEAQRVMSNADGNQILVSEVVYNTLRDREKYMRAFERYSAKIKHGDVIAMYQLKIEGQPGLDLDTPSAFEAPSVQKPRLNRRLAYYMAHAIKNKRTIIDKNLSDDRVIIILLYFLAKDSEAEADATEMDTVHYDTYKAGQATFEEQYSYYAGIDFNVSWELYRFISNSFFWEKPTYYYKYFHQSSSQISDFRFVDEAGERKLKNEWPQIWDGFGLDADEPKEEARDG